MRYQWWGTCLFGGGWEGDAWVGAGGHAQQSDVKVGKLVGVKLIGGGGCEWRVDFFVGFECCLLDSRALSYF